MGILAVLGPFLAVFALGFAGAAAPFGCRLHHISADKGVCATVKTSQTPHTVCRAVLPIPAAALACLVYASLARGSACG